MENQDFRAQVLAATDDQATRQGRGADEPAQAAPIEGNGPALTSIQNDRRESTRSAAGRFWWPAIAAALALVVVVAIAAALGSNRDRGVRGPADQGAPEAPAAEKTRPSNAR